MCRKEDHLDHLAENMGIFDGASWKTRRIMLIALRKARGFVRFFDAKAKTMMDHLGNWREVVRCRLPVVRKLEVGGQMTPIAGNYHIFSALEETPRISKICKRGRIRALDEESGDQRTEVRAVASGGCVTAQTLRVLKVLRNHESFDGFRAKRIEGLAESRTSECGSTRIWCDGAGAGICGMEAQSPRLSAPYQCAQRQQLAMV